MSTNPNRANISGKTLKLVLAALLAAMALALKPLSIKLLPTVRLSFIPVPVLIAGTILGPIWGALVGIVVDVGGFLIAPDGAWNPFITIAVAVVGMIPGIVFNAKRKGVKAKWNLLNVCAYVALLVIVISLFALTKSIKLEDGVVSVVSPGSLKWTPVAWWVIGAIFAAFIFYSIVVILMATKKKVGGEKLDAETTSAILFAVTCAYLCGYILIEGTALAVMYGWKLPITYAIKIFQSFLSIPLYSLLVMLVYPVLEKQVKKLQ